MLENKTIRQLNDYFLTLDSRPQKGVYFYRINGYSQEVRDFIYRYYETARKCGVIIQGKIPNPDEKNLSYYGEIMGMSFQLQVDFIQTSLKKWLPRLNDVQRDAVTSSMYNLLQNMKKDGKNENMLKNAYIKFMCWMYYKFERILSQLGKNDVPKILYEGDISKYELMLFSILAGAGCDIVLLQYHGDAGYLKLDGGSKQSMALELPGLGAFPAGFSLNVLKEELLEQSRQQRMYGTLPQVNNCTNAWIEGTGLADIKKPVGLRGQDSRFFYNCFYRITGAEDKVTYANELFQLQQELRNAQRRLVIVSGSIPKPANEEITAIKRGNYAKLEQLVMGLSGNIKYSASVELQRIMQKAFVDVLVAESKQPENSLNRLTNKAVYMLCWLKRYQSQLFGSWQLPEVGCFIYLGGCKDEYEALFLRFIARLPVDVLILCPNLNVQCCLEDELLYEIKNPDSLVLDKYPEDNSQVRMGTVAYHAERELDTLMYQDTGMYRNQQYGRAQSINLQTMYEEIPILWDQELKYRPSFSINDDVVNIPTIFARVMGVKEGLVDQYWREVGALVTEDTFVIRQAPYIDSKTTNPMKSYAAGFYKNGRLNKKLIKEHPKYPYGIIREEMQDYILDKLDNLIKRRLIKGIGENGTEYLVIAQVLNLPKEIIRLVQKFDFTKKNPKLIYINTTEKVLSLEDTILFVFLNLLGFDVVFFIPTGYRCVEKYLNTDYMEEHQIGEYKYDLRVPDFGRPSVVEKGLSLYERIVKRGKELWG